MKPGPVETKVAASSITAAAVTLTIELLTTYVHGFHPPSPGVTALIITVLTAVVGWLAPHTPRNAVPPAAGANVLITQAQRPEGTTP